MEQGGVVRINKSNDNKQSGLFCVAWSISSGGQIVLGALDPERLADKGPSDICLRMRVILETIEMPRGEGRLLPTDLFDRLDTLESMVVHGYGTPRISEWKSLMREFGCCYNLRGGDPIAVDSNTYRETSDRYSVPPHASPGS